MIGLGSMRTASIAQRMVRGTQTVWRPAPSARTISRATTCGSTATAPPSVRRSSRCARSRGARRARVRRPATRRRRSRARGSRAPPSRRRTPAFERRGRSAATDESTTIVPAPRARIRRAVSSEQRACAERVDVARTSAAASRSAAPAPRRPARPSTPTARIARSIPPPSSRSAAASTCSCAANSRASSAIVSTRSTAGSRAAAAAAASSAARRGPRARPRAASARRAPPRSRARSRSARRAAATGGRLASRGCRPLFAHGVTRRSAPELGPAE